MRRTNALPVPKTSHKALASPTLLCSLTLSAERAAPFAAFERVAKSIPYPAFSISDDTAVKVVDGVISVVGGGKWQRVNSDESVAPRA